MTTVPIARKPDPRKWWLLGALAAIPSVTLAIVVGVLGREPIQAAWIIAAIAVLMLAAFVLADRSKHVRYEIGGGRLRIRGDVFGRTIPLSDLRLEEAEVVDLDARKELRPKWKLCGTALPGYCSGHFSLRNGKLAFVFLSDMQHVLMLPKTNKKLILLSCPDPAETLASIKAAVL